MKATPTHATHQLVMEFIKSEHQLTQLNAENVKTANSQDTFQTTLELLVF